MAAFAAYAMFNEAKAICVAIHTGDWKGYIKGQIVSSLASTFGGPIGGTIGGSIAGPVGAQIGNAVGSAALAAVMTDGNIVEAIAQAAIMAYLQYTFAQNPNPSSTPDSDQTVGEQHAKELSKTSGNAGAGSVSDTTGLDRALVEYEGPLLADADNDKAIALAISDKPAFTAAQYEKIEQILEYEKEHGPVQTARMFSNTGGKDGLKLGPEFDNKPILTKYGVVDLDWFTDVRRFGGGLLISDLTYLVGKSLWNGLKTIAGLPTGRPYGDPKEQLALSLSRRRMWYRDLFPKDFMEKHRPPGYKKPK